MIRTALVAPFFAIGLVALSPPMPALAFACFDRLGDVRVPERSRALIGKVTTEGTFQGVSDKVCRVVKAHLLAGTPSQGVVYITDKAGWQRLLRARFNRDYFMISSYVESEKFLTFCAIASMAATLNSLDIPRPLDVARYPYPYFTQDNIFVLANEQIKSFESVITEGLMLAEIGEFLGSLGVLPKLAFAGDAGINAMRDAIIVGLEAENTRVIVNYDRSVLGQVGAGHVSPIGAYDESTDSVLVLDVARYKYPPVWVPMEMMYRSMLAVDPGSGRTRGIVVLGPTD